MAAYNYPYPGVNPTYTPMQTYQPPMYQPAVQMPQTAPQAAQQPGYICCPVTSREEAVAYRVEAFGPSVVMPDLGHGMIYFKRFNEKTALADFGEFRYVPPEQKDLQTPEIDYTSIVSGFANRLDSMGEKIDAIFEQLNQKPAAKTAKGAVEK